MGYTKDSIGKKYFDVSNVFQATVGHQNYGFWTTREEAEEHIKNCVPDAKPFEGIATEPGSVPNGYYYIQKRTVYSYKKPK